MGKWRIIWLALFLLGAGAASVSAQSPLMFPPQTPSEYPPPGYSPYPSPGYPPPGYPGMGGYPNTMTNYPPVPWGAPIPGAPDPRIEMEKLDKQNKSPNPLIIPDGPNAFPDQESCIKDQGCYVNNRRHGPHAQLL